METILVVDDSNTNISILIELLGEEYDIVVALEGESAIETAVNEKIDLILLDILMPGIDGFEVCKKLKSNDITKEIPIIFLTAKSDEASIEKAFEIGGSDYVTKPFRPKELIARVKKELKLQTLINQLEIAKEEQKQLALTDPMTKLYNRRYFTKTSENIYNISKRENKNLSVIIIDIDKFKNINDIYGHKMGDKVIIKFGEILKQHQRQSDIICRYGGEEFVILLPNTDINGAYVIAQKIREYTQNYKIELDSGIYLDFTISLGISQIDFEKEIDIEKALNRADDALYEAKNTGRNKTVIKEFKS